MTTFLLNPNFAYLCLVLGFLLMIFAILQPGTGMFELSAIFILVLAGWQIYNLQINIWALILLLLSVIPFMIAIWRKGKSIYLSSAILAFVIGSSFIYRDGESWFSPAVNPILAFTVSIIVGGLLWIMIYKVLEARNLQPSHDLDNLIGENAEAQTIIYKTGSIYASGESWTAKSDKKIKSGSQVRIIEREGFVLKVEEIIGEE